MAKPRSKIKSRIVSEKITVYTIWDNFARHEQELRDAGASDPQIEELREAAAAVSKEEEAAAAQSGRNPAFNAASLADILLPYTCVNGWVIQPPSMIARRWAVTAVMAVTGGREPSTAMGLLHSLVAGLLVLKLYGEGDKSRVLSIVSSDALADILPDACDAFAGSSIEAIALDYMTLMGMQKKTAAREAYNLKLADLAAMCSAKLTTPALPHSSQPATPRSARAGRTTSTPRPRSSTPASGSQTGSTR